MGTVRKVPQAALIAGITYADSDVLDKAVNSLEDEFGSLEMKSADFDFTMTDYYADEMGKDLKKIFCCFENPVELETLPDIKHRTNEIELRFAEVDEGNIRRRVNIDPGYVTLSKLVLVTTKDYSHRIFIGKGIYAETTLRFIKDSFMPLETTYPDYKTKLAIDFFNKVRDYLKEKRNTWTREKE